jgi:hypothetical protein
MNKVLEKIDNYLQLGGMFNPEEMEHHKVRDMLLDCRNELERLVDKCDKQAMILRRIYVEHYPDTWYVANGYGETDQNNLPQYIEVVPAWGVDWSQIYERTERTIPGMGG